MVSTFFYYNYSNYNVKKWKVMVEHDSLGCLAFLGGGGAGELQSLIKCPSLLPVLHHDTQSEGFPASM